MRSIVNLSHGRHLGRNIVSVTGAQSRCGRSLALHRANRQRGFSLIEMMLVVALIAAIASITTVSLVGRLDSVQTAGAARDVASALRSTRAMALRLREAQVMKVNVDERTVTIPGRKPILLPKTLELKLYTADQEINSRSEGAIRFYPDGGSTGGKVTLIANQRTWEVAVSWLTGEISINDSARAGRRP